MFKVWCGTDAADVNEWICLWEAWPHKEVFAHPRYVALFADSGSVPMCAAWRSEDGIVLYPFLLRDIRTERYAPKNQGPLTDIATPYGYGGPFYWGSRDANEIATLFWEDFAAWTASQNVVSEFIRFTLFRDTTLPYLGHVDQKQDNVVRDLGLDEEMLWMDFEHKVRKNVKKAIRSGVEIEIDPKAMHFDEFYRIYTETMERRDAKEDYHFSRDFFASIHDGLPGQYAYFHALHNGVVISSELVLISADNVYSFLGGTDSSAFSLRPNDLLKYHVILWARSVGKQRFVLGGGHSPNDGIFRYKIAFAPGGSYSFCTGTRILRPEIYAQLVHGRACAPGTNGPWVPRAGYFPAYRA